MRYRHPLLAALVVVFALASTACGSGTGGPPGAHAAKGAPSEALRFTASTLDSRPFDGVTFAGKPAVLFWEPSCSKRRAQAPEVGLTADLHDGSASVVGVAGAGGIAFL